MISVEAKIIGYVGADAVIKENSRGKFLSFPIYVKTKRDAPKKGDMPTFYSVAYSRGNIEKLMPYIKKGNLIYVEGQVNYTVLKNEVEQLYKMYGACSAYRIALLPSEREHGQTMGSNDRQEGTDVPSAEIEQQSQHAEFVDDEDDLPF